MRLPLAAILLCSSAAFAQNALPPTWSTSQGDSIQNQAKLPKVTAAQKAAAQAASRSLPGLTGNPAPAAVAPAQAPYTAAPAAGASAAPAPAYAAQPAAAAAPAYSAPTPAPTYSAPAPAPTYSAPAPAPTYSAPAPAPTYSAPGPAYSAPAPAPAYSAPAAASSAYAAPSAATYAPAATVAPSSRHSANLPPPSSRSVPVQAAAAPTVAAPPRTYLPAGTLIDISAPLDPRTTPVYEGNPPIQFYFTADMDHGDKLDLSLYSFGSHTGTHIDAPLHFLKGGATIDQVPLPQFIGPARVIDVDPRVSAITAAELERYNWRGASRILFRTRNSVNNWIVDPVFHRDFVYLAPDAAELLASSGVELVGIDYLSVEQFGAAAPQAHINLLRRGCIIAEGLDLRSVAPGDYKLTILPLRIMGHEAAPARAVLEVLP